MSTAQSAGSSPVLGRPKRGSVVTEQPRFDLESYVQNYKGRTRLERLIFVGVWSSFLGVDALKAAVIEAKKGRDVRRYIEAQAHLSNVGPGEREAVRDQSWIDRVERENVAETQRLEAELKGYKNNLIKESIRMGNEDLGKHYQAIGELSKAFDAFSRMRQDATITRHIIEVQKHLVEVAIEQRNFPQVLSNCQKIMATLSSLEPEDKSLQPYTSAAEGLAYMDSGEYLAAAHAFLNTDEGVALRCSTFISPNDVAVYGGLCALATMERPELHSKVLENSKFRAYLEMEPHIRHAITFFVNSRYSACLGILESYKADYLLDIHLHKHVEALYAMVRTKSIVQYFIPFSCVTLESLNEAFAIGGAQGQGQGQAKSVEKELVGMIQRGELDARIDTQNRLLISLPATTRATIQSDALRTAHDYEREARRRLQHMNIRAAGLGVPSVKKSAQAGQGGMMGMMASMGDEFFDAGGRGGRGKFLM